jgi:hypothetical protein
MPDRISRGEILSLLGGMPLAIAVAVATSAASASDDSGGTKAKYKYISTPGPKAQKCIACALFVSPAGCTIVKGNISPNGYCIAFAPKAKPKAK